MESRSSAARAAMCEPTRRLLSDTRKLKCEKLLQWSWTTWRFSNPPQNSASPTAAASSLLSPILIRRGVCTPPYQSPRAHKHICLLFIQPLLFHLHILRSALYILEETGPYAYHRSPAHHFQIRRIHRRTRWREWSEESRRLMTLKTMCQPWIVCTCLFLFLC